ncbi:WD domain, G-beta repeat protein [Ancylostoma caninum]|uniref:WD domain, G-beta repeat protein n=1 Tax=Ancylostoma caninum TaxID=29170 RepID=A0A368GLH6_ANCCA|nr:WD domain, G-beta repeat protein [Ancylostoma caninum]
MDFILFLHKHGLITGADGSARMFDLRHLEHSTIVYEDPLKLPLMRVAWNKQEHYHLATFAQDSTEVIIIDIRMPCSPLARLKNHNGAVNGLAWAPHSAHHICTASDDAQALIWDLQNMPRPVEDPILAYSAGGEVGSSTMNMMMGGYGVQPSQPQQPPYLPPQQPTPQLMQTDVYDPMDAAGPSNQDISMSSAPREEDKRKVRSRFILRLIQFWTTSAPFQIILHL